MATDLSAFQRVLEAVEAARAAGSVSASSDTTTRETDDQDAYPRGIELYLDRKDPVWYALRLLSKHLDWLTLETRSKHLFIAAPQDLSFHNTRIAYQEAVAEALKERGIDCASNVYYR